MTDRISSNASLDEIVERTGEIAESVVAEDAERIDREFEWPERGIRALQEAGLGGLVVPAEHGGLGQGVLGIIRVCEEIGKYCASTAISFGMHLVASAVIAAKATEDQAERYLEPIARGEHLTTLSLSEPGTGSEFYIPQTSLEQTGDTLRLNGKKCFVTNGDRADSYVVSTRTPGTEFKEGQFSMVVVDRESEGIEWEGPWEGFGMHGNHSINMTLEDVTVPADDLLGKHGDEIWYVFYVICPFFLSSMAGTYAGVAARAYRETHQHLQNRKYDHTGETLGEVSHLQRKLARMWSKVKRTRQYLYWAGREYDTGGDEAFEAIGMTKAESARCATEICNQAMTLCGGKAYAKNSVLARLLRDVRAAHVMAPTTDQLELWAGRSLLDLPVLGE